LDYVVTAKQGEMMGKGRGAKGMAWEFARGIVELGYGVGARQRVEGLERLVRNG